jgi:hypothetical protein
MNTTERELLQECHQLIDQNLTFINGKDNLLQKMEAYLSKPEASQDELVAFLNGSTPLEGVYFGEKHPTKKGLYWWRKLLPCSLAKPVQKTKVWDAEGYDALCQELSGEAKPAQEPMSEDELDVLINQCMGAGGVRVFEFAAAIEAHHGIK